MNALENPALTRKFLGIVQAESDRMYSLVNDIMSITKMESGQEQVELTRVNVPKRINKIFKELTPEANQTGVELKYCSDAGDIVVIANERQLDQVLTNLIQNGVKYSDKCKERRQVNVYLVPNAAAGKVTLSVQDNGIGVEQKHLDRLFERFYRVDKGRSRNMGGTGLGLAIVKHIVEDMHWEIEVNSKLNEGTEFAITMPLAPQEEPSETTTDDFWEE